MTTPKKDGSLYLWLFATVIGLLGLFMGMVWNYNSNVNQFMMENTREHYEIMRAFDRDTSWTRWVHRNQIVPAYELSYENEKDLKVIKHTLFSIDSNLIVNNSHFKRVFLFLRENRVDNKAIYKE